ncbi:MAG: hypothetical protein ACWA41_01400 [Putridiphycobacter sp.]
MKKLLGVVLGLILSVSALAGGGVTYNDVNTAEKSKAEGVFTFAFDSNFTLEEINKTAQYYTSYFSVSPVKSENGFTVTIKIIEDNEMSRRVVTRFFVSLEVKEIMVSGASIGVEDFVSKYVMQ